LDAVTRRTNPENLEEKARLVLQFLDDCEHEAHTLLAGQLLALRAVANHMGAHLNEQVPGDVLQTLIADAERPPHD
jgi:hypothetical protein